MVQNMGRWQRIARFSTVVVGAIALGLSSCASEPTPGEQDGDGTAVEPSLDDELQVVTTVLPITQFTRAVAGDRAEVTQLLPTNVGPHNFQAKPADVQAIAQADVLVQNGLELESFLDDLIVNAGNSELAVIDSSEGIPTLAYAADEHHHSDGEAEGSHSSHAGEEEHNSDHAADHDHSSAEDADEEGHAEGEAHQHGEFDPHIWLDPKRAIQQVENIRDGLIAADPEGASNYTENAEVYIEQLTALDQEIASRLEPYAGQTFISFHDFAFYFADSYNLNVEHLVDIPEENPSPEDIRRIIETTQTENLKALLTEPQSGENAFSALAKDLSIEVSVFDPMETGEPAATDPESYFTIMRQNVDNLEAAFGGALQSWLIPSMAQPRAIRPVGISL